MDSLTAGALLTPSPPPPFFATVMCSVGGRDVLDGADDAVLGVAVDVTAGVTVDVTAAVVMLVVLVCGCVAAPGPVDSPSRSSKHTQINTPHCTQRHP